MERQFVGSETLLKMDMPIRNTCWRLVILGNDVLFWNDFYFFFSRGEGIARDNEEAVHWFKLASEQGHVEAATNLGLCYEGTDFRFTTKD